MACTEQIMHKIIHNFPKILFCASMVEGLGFPTSFYCKCDMNIYDIPICINIE